MNLHILDPHGDIILVLRDPDKQTLDGAWWPKKSKKYKRAKRNRNASDFAAVADAFEGLFLGEAVELESLNGSTTGLADTKGYSMTTASDRPHCLVNSYPNELRFRASSSHLRLSSAIFQRMIDGTYPETSMNEKIRFEDGSECRVLHTTEWDGDVFLMLMNWIHGRHGKVPETVSLMKLAKFAVLVDYYQCHEITAMLGGSLIRDLRESLPTSHGQASSMWIFISWVFLHKEIFEKMTEMALKGSTSPIAVSGLPFPGRLICMFILWLGNG